MKEPLEEGGTSTRRGFFAWLVRVFLSLWGFAGLGVVLSFLRAPEVEPRVQIIPGGSFSDLRMGRARLVRHGSRPLYVLKVSETEAVALSAVCTHRQCVLNWSQERTAFLCPCHAGVFDAAGNVVSGPPQQPLERYRATIYRDEVVIHLT